MYAKIFVLLLGVSCGCAIDLPKYLGHDMNLLQLMTAQMDMGRSASSMECFQYYIPILNKITATYEKEYGKCENTATRERALVDEETRTQRRSIDDRGIKACDALNVCRSKTDTVQYFECYTKTGSDNSLEMYKISNDASDALTIVTERLRVIGITEDGCKKTAERNYIENSVSTNGELNDCLAGQDNIPPTTTPKPRRLLL